MTFDEFKEALKAGANGIGKHGSIWKYRLSRYEIFDGILELSDYSDNISWVDFETCGPWSIDWSPVVQASIQEVLDETE